MTRNDYGDITTILQAIINPLTSKLQTLEDKVDKLNTDRVTRTDFENLRKEISGSYVQRDVYESRHASLIERDMQLESRDRELEKEHVEDIKELKGSVAQAVQQLEDRIKQQTEAQLSHKDRNWLRVTQWIGVLAIILSILDWLFQHIKLQ